MYLEARKLLDDGEAYISMPTQQKVMAKVSEPNASWLTEASAPGPARYGTSGWC